MNRSFLRVLTSSQRKQLYSSSTISPTFKVSELKIRKSKYPQAIPTNDADLAFGKRFSDHMMIAQWNGVKGWQRPVIKQIQELKLHPAAKVFHYSIEIFEGLKAYRGVDGKIRLFRPDMNAERMNKSAERSCLPTFDTNEWLECVKAFIKVEQDWIPPCGEDLTTAPTYYIRPFMMGTEPTLGIGGGNKALFMIIGGPVGPYFSTGFKPISLYADPDMIRAWPGGTGNAKMGSNYGPTLKLQQQASEKGCHQVLWLFQDKITEVGTMNLFVAIKTESGIELVTPPLESGLILPGVTRNSIVELAKQWDGVTMVERDMTIDELLKLNEDKKILEIFGAGTACVVCPVGEIVYKGERHGIPTVSDGLLSRRALKQMTAMQFGETSDKPEWIVEV